MSRNFYVKRSNLSTKRQKYNLSAGLTADGDLFAAKDRWDGWLKFISDLVPFCLRATINHIEYFCGGVLGFARDLVVLFAKHLLIHLEKNLGWKAKRYVSVIAGTIESQESHDAFA